MTYCASTRRMENKRKVRVTASVLLLFHPPQTCTMRYCNVAQYTAAAITPREWTMETRAGSRRLGEFAKSKQIKFLGAKAVHGRKPCPKTINSHGATII